MVLRRPRDHLVILDQVIREFNAKVWGCDAAGSCSAWNYLGALQLCFRTSRVIARLMEFGIWCQQSNPGPAHAWHV